MSLREEQCNKVCTILDNILANRPTERDSLIVAVRKAFKAQPEPHWIPVTKEEMFKAGYDGREIIFKVDGRLSAIRELAQ